MTARCARRPTRYRIERLPLPILPLSPIATQAQRLPGWPTTSAQLALTMAEELQRGATLPGLAIAVAQNDCIVFAVARAPRGESVP